MEASAPPGRSADPRSERPAKTHRSAWISFAGILMLILGCLDAIWGIAAIANNEIVVVGGNGALIFDITTWGWIQLILGIVVALTGLGLLMRNEIASVLAIFLLSANAVLQVVWFTAAPLWAILIIALDVVIIWQLINDWSGHGEPDGR
jgi:hypothetical protein